MRTTQRVSFQEPFPHCEDRARPISDRTTAAAKPKNRVTRQPFVLPERNAPGPTHESAIWFHRTSQRATPPARRVGPTNLASTLVQQPSNKSSPPATLHAIAFRCLSRQLPQMPGSSLYRHRALVAHP